MVFLMLGFAAGVLNVMRTAGVARDGGTGDRDPR
jgi:F0F1-type ATP synthase assembly protein I